MGRLKWAAKKTVSGPFEQLCYRGVNNRFYVSDPLRGDPKMNAGHQTVIDPITAPMPSIHAKLTASSNRSVVWQIRLEIEMPIRGGPISPIEREAHCSSQLSIPSDNNVEGVRRGIVLVFQQGGASIHVPFLLDKNQAAKRPYYSEAHFTPIALDKQHDLTSSVAVP
jgi:hypothetical protein